MHSFFDTDPNMSHWQRLQRLQQVRTLSPSARGMKLEQLDPDALRVVEERVLAEARETARTSGRLFRTAERDRGGRLIEKFEGDPNAWLAPFKAKGVRISINKNSGTH